MIKNKNKLVLLIIAALAIPVLAVLPARAAYNPRSNTYINAVGTHKTAAVLVNFADDQRRPFTAAQTEEALFTGSDSMSAYFKNVSFGKMKLAGIYASTGDVYDWVTVPASYRKCDNNTLIKLGEKANELAEKATGHSLKRYKNYMYIYPRQDACKNPNNGRTINGTTLGNATFINSRNNTNFIGVDVHEFSHELGASHTNDAYCTDEKNRPVTLKLSDTSRCVAYVYGDPYDPMGKARLVAGKPIDFDALNKVRLGWIDLKHIKTVKRSKVVTLYPSEVQAPGVQLIRIPYAYLDGQQHYLYIDYRQPLGEDAKLGASDPLFSGITLREAGFIRHNKSTKLDDYSYLIDTNPQTKTMADAPLGVGKTYSDKGYGIEVTLRSMAPSKAEVAITLSKSSDKQR